MRQHVLWQWQKPHTAERAEETPKSFGHWLALAKELAFGEWLLEIVPPRRQIGVRVRFGIPWVVVTSSVTMPTEGSKTALTG